MKTYFDCYPCFVRQALRAARLVNADETQQHLVLQRTLALLQHLPAGATPPEIGHQVDQIVHSLIDAPDPYLEVKRTSTEQAMSLYPRLKALVSHSDDRLAAAIRVSIAGNIIDFALNDHIADLWETVERVMQQAYAIDDQAALKMYLKSAGQILYLADNAGETVFDRILIEELPVPVIYAVKDGPVINDATLQDALAVGLDSCATLISNGARAPGTILSLCSASFREQFENAPVIIAKGQANFETLSESGAKIFCLLQVKCPVIGADLHVPAGSIVVHQSAQTQ